MNIINKIKHKKILVVGGAGYIGSHMVRLLKSQGLIPIVLDDLSGGFEDSVNGAELIVGNVGNRELLNNLFKEHKIDTVMHFASFIQVRESLSNPAKYYENNLGNTITLLNEMANNGIKKFIFSSTAAIFGNPISEMIDESHPQIPINPYGRSKWMVEQVLTDYELAYGIQHVCLRYFNAAGAHPDGSLGERHQPETHLIPLAIAAGLGRGPELKVFGSNFNTLDGTCIRDYVHICDLVDAHLLGNEHLDSGKGSLKINLGNGSGYSVMEVIDTVREVLKRQVPYSIVDRRQGDPSKLVANSAFAKSSLGWTPRYPKLRDIIEHAVNWHRGK